jgi:hypothetical protein
MLAPVLVAVLPDVLRLLEGAMSGAKSRGKGARGEREIVTLLRSALPDGWTVERFGTGESGHDIRIAPPDGGAQPFALEVKRYRDFEIGEVLRGPSARFVAWWRQTRSQADRVGREPLLVTRGDRRPWWLWAPRQYGDGHVNVELQLPLADGVSEVLIGVPLASALEDLAFDIQGGA